MLPHSLRLAPEEAPLFLVSTSSLPAAPHIGADEFTSAFENAAIGMAVVGLDSRRLRVNRAFCRMLGYAEDAMLTHTVEHITHPEDLGVDLAQRQLLLDGHKHTYEREKRYLRRDGTVVWGHLTCTLVRDSEGRPRHFISQVQDISERKAAEEACALAEERLRETQASLHIAAQIGRLGAWSYKAGAAHVTWSEEVCAIHEVRQGFAPTFQEALAFFAPQYRDRIERILQACLRSGTPFDVEAQIITAKGKQIWARVLGEAEWDAQGRVRQIQGACQDISDSLRAAEETRIMAEQLTTTLESLTDAFYTVDRNWRFTYVNAQGERLARRGRAELLGRRLLDVYPELAETSMVQQFSRAMEANVTVEFEEYFAPFDIWIQVKVFPSLQGLAIDVKDVTERVLAGREIMRLNAELEERVMQRTAQLAAANKELEAFSYSIAHDLRGPLSSIDGFSRILDESAGDGLGDRCRHYLSRIRAGVRQMGELTDGLLALANLSRTSLRRDEVDLSRLARQAVAACRERAPERHAEIAVEPNLFTCGDPRLLSQVIFNLMGNAWKFTARREHARIEIGSLPGEDEQTVFFVRDNGAGFDMAYASKMFEAFQRMHTASEFEGTGIGLAIVHKIVSRHGGRIWADAQVDRGANFYFTLGPGGDARAV
ncbi:PAS domain S-box protein [Ramlibacter sp. WS9]|uniref:PAS domain S-box protein n=1 Tax=Ramlibacter sp. WS9 TaxID=1882741 RepID=UPI0011441F07|nr:PAS domain S-box protein [Ramlibacter sp. WS9]ROZ62107.1 PAS domain S-box protein [Ramlibacter sp. WS9]